MQWVRLATLGLVLAVTGCATVNQPSLQENESAKAARQMADAGDYQQAAQAYMQLARTDGNLRDHYLLRAARSWEKADDTDNAATVLAKIDRHHLRTDDKIRHDLLTAGIALDRGDAAPALAFADSMIATWPTTLTERALDLRARAQAATGHVREALHTRTILAGLLPPSRRATNDRQAVALLVGQGIARLQTRLQSTPKTNATYPWLVEALRELGATMPPTYPELSRPVDTFTSDGQHAAGYRMPNNIVLILPLSGPSADAGKAVRQGFMTAYFQTNITGIPPPPLVVRDTGGSSARAIAAYRQAVDNGADMVVGPLLRGPVSALLARGTLPIPVLALNHPQPDHLPPADVMEFALRPESEGAQIAVHMRESGLSQAIILHGPGDAARRAAGSFDTRFRQAGGNVIDTRVLGRDDIDYRQQIDAFNLPRLNPDHVGIFLAMSPSLARLLMPQLRVAGSHLPVFATSQVHAGNAAPIADADLDGMTFCAMPWLIGPGVPGLPSRSVAAALSIGARNGHARLFAFGMDAWTLLPYLDALRESPGRYLPGATGFLTADRFGRIHHTCSWARFRNGIPQANAGVLLMNAPTTKKSTAEPAS